MEVTLRRKQTSFRLREDLLERLRDAAQLANSSLNSYVESVLMDDVCCEPNPETLAAIDEVRSGRCDGKPVDISRDEAFVKSILE